MAKPVTIRAAIITATALIAAAVISGLFVFLSGLRPQGESPTPVTLPGIDSVEVARFIEVLEVHADHIRAAMTAKESLLVIVEPQGGPHTDELRAVRKRFEQLHPRCVSAYRSGNIILAHELSNEINHLVGRVLPAVPEHQVYYPK